MRQYIRYVSVVKADVCVLFPRSMPRRQFVWVKHIYVKQTAHIRLQTMLLKCALYMNSVHVVISHAMSLYGNGQAYQQL